MKIEDYFETFKIFVRETENLEIDLNSLAKLTFRKTSVMCSSLKQYLTCEEFSELVFNLWLHYLIVDSGAGNPLYSKYEVTQNQVLVTSTSAGGSSASMEVPKTISDGDLFAYDLYRTPYGRFALTIMESLKFIAIARL